MSDEVKKPISDRQAAARRQNGKKSRGPVTAEGKQRSSQNSTSRGYWARSWARWRGVLTRGSPRVQRFHT